LVDRCYYRSNPAFVLDYQFRPVVALGYRYCPVFVLDHPSRVAVALDCLSQVVAAFCHQLLVVFLLAECSLVAASLGDIHAEYELQVLGNANERNKYINAKHHRKYDYHNDNNMSGLANKQLQLLVAALALAVLRLAEFRALAELQHKPFFQPELLL
jgi:hypothetical protein